MAVVAVAGEVDLANVHQLEAALAAAIERSCQVVADLREVSFFGACGIEALEGALALGRRAGCALGVVPSGPVARVIELTGTGGVIPVVPAEAPMASSTEG